MQLIRSSKFAQSRTLESPTFTIHILLPSPSKFLLFQISQGDETITLFLIIIADKSSDRWVLPDSRRAAIGRRLTYGEPINSTGSSSTQRVANTLHIDDSDLDEPEGILI